MRILIIFTAFLLGCKTPEAETIVVSNNEQKDSYLAKVEEVVSESASALVAVVPSIPNGIPRQIIEGQATRLSGLSKPSVEKVKEFERMVRENDLKAVEADKARALQVDEETSRLWAVVEEQNQKLDEANLLREQAELRAKEERKTKMLFQASSAFLALCVVGILVGAFTPFKKAGVIIVIMSTALGALVYYVA